MALNIVIPVYNEDDRLLSLLQQLAGYLNPVDKLVVVDASDENIPRDLSSHSVFQLDNIFYLKSNKGRALQMNAGAEFLLSKTDNIHGSDLLWFLHCDSGLTDKHFNYLRSLDGRIDKRRVWGRFDIELSPNDFPFPIISKFMNVRSRLTQVMTGDQGIFIRSDVFQQIKGYADIPLMEDVDISKRLRVLAKADCNGPVMQTSARRWQQQGWVKTVLLMWQLRLKYWIGVSPEKLVKRYYG